MSENKTKSNQNSFLSRNLLMYVVAPLLIILLIIVAVFALTSNKSTKNLPTEVNTAVEQLDSILAELENDDINEYPPQFSQ
jgi:cytoskeletal protein RodZ